MPAISAKNVIKFIVYNISLTFSDVQHSFKGGFKKYWNAPLIVNANLELITQHAALLMTAINVCDMSAGLVNCLSEKL